MSNNQNAKEEEILKLTELGWTVGSHEILDDINFSIKTGEFVGLIGPNGAGKSSLMRCCYRALKPSKGQVRILEQDIWKHPLKRNAKLVGVILQEHSEQAGLTVRDVVEQGLTPHKRLFEWDSQEDKQIVEKTIEELDLESLKNAEYCLLSGGEKQRVMLARAIVQRPQLLIMDEPTNHLDVHYQIDLMKKVQGMSLTVLASFHDLNLASAYCDRLLVLEKGKLIADGRPQDVLTENMLKKTFNAASVVDKNPLTGQARISYVY